MIGDVERIRIVALGEVAGVDGQRRTGHEHRHVAAAEQHDSPRRRRARPSAERVGVETRALDVDACGCSGAICDRERRAYR